MSIAACVCFSVQMCGESTTSEAGGKDGKRGEEDTLGEANQSPPLVCSLRAFLGVWCLSRLNRWRQNGCGGCEQLCPMRTFCSALREGCRLPPCNGAVETPGVFNGHKCPFCIQSPKKARNKTTQQTKNNKQNNKTTKASQCRLR